MAPLLVASLTSLGEESGWSFPVPCLESLLTFCHSRGCGSLSKAAECAVHRAEASIAPGPEDTGQRAAPGRVSKAQGDALSTCEHICVPGDHPQDLQRNLSTLTQRDPSLLCSLRCSSLTGLVGKAPGQPELLLACIKHILQCWNGACCSAAPAAGVAPLEPLETCRKFPLVRPSAAPRTWVTAPP